MEVFTHAGLQMLILFTLVALGFVARKRHMMNDDFDSQVTSVVMNIALPGMIIDSVLSNQNLPDTSTILMLLLYSFSDLCGYLHLCSYHYARALLACTKSDKRCI